jgi:hypothetical protein
MRSFRVVLSVGGAVYVDAERYEWVGDFVRFYRGDSITAEYPAGHVTEEISERTLTQKIQIFTPVPPPNP